VAQKHHDDNRMVVTEHKTIDSFYLRTVQVCGEHDDGVRQHVGSVSTGKQGLSATQDAYQGNGLLSKFKQKL